MKSLLKVLMVCTDRKLFEDGSVVAKRIENLYAPQTKEMHIVVFALKKLGLREREIASNVWIYPTNSMFRWMYPLDAVRIGRKLVRDKGFVRGQSLITTQDPFECGWAGLQIKKRWHLPLEAQLHTDPFSPFFTGFQNRVRLSIFNNILKNTDAVRVVSKELQDKVAPLTKAEVSVLPLYIDKEKIENAPISFDLHGRYPWRFIILAVARLSPEKNLSMAIRILSLVRQKFPDTGLVMAGSGPEESRLKVLVGKLGLNGAVEFAGWQTDLASYYKTSNVFIQTSFFEGYGLALVEAGLSGLPVVTTPVGIASELENGRDAYIYPAESLEDFAAGVVDLLENNFKRENLKINLKRTLDSKLLSETDYTSTIEKNWNAVSKKVL